MKRIAIIAGFVGAAGLVLAAPAGAQADGGNVAAPSVQAQQNINGQPVRQFLGQFEAQTDRFLNGTNDPQDPHAGILNQHKRFVTGIAGQADRFEKSVKDFFNAGGDTEE